LEKVTLTAAPAPAVVSIIPAIAIVAKLMVRIAHSFFELPPALHIGVKRTDSTMNRKEAATFRLHNMTIEFMFKAGVRTELR
jgi:hypothetical protein